jgi:hypothetical protein
MRDLPSVRRRGSNVEPRHPKDELIHVGRSDSAEKVRCERRQSERPRRLEERERIEKFLQQVARGWRRGDDNYE